MAAALPFLAGTVTARAETTDADRDGLTAAEGLAWGLHAAVPDRDGDGLTDGDEVRDGYAHTDPADLDTDADGVGMGPSMSSPTPTTTTTTSTTPRSSGTDRFPPWFRGIGAGLPADRALGHLRTTAPTLAVAWPAPCGRSMYGWSV